MLMEQRQRARRIDAGVVRQTARDVAFLEFMAHQYGMPMDLVAQAAGVSMPRTYALVSRWKRAGWVKTGKVDTGPTWVWPTKSTARQYLGWDAAEWTPRATTTQHVRAVAAVRLHRVGFDLERWISERTLRHEGGYRVRGQTEPHLPDGVEVLADGRRVLVEVELTAKAPSRYLEPARQTFEAYDGLLLEIQNRARQLGCVGVAYWCAPAALDVVQRSVVDFQERIRRAQKGKPNDVQWFVCKLEEVPGWAVPERR